MGPAAHEPAADVPQLCQLHFQFALEAACALREDVQNEAVAVEDASADQLLEVALLAGGERVVDEDDVGGVFCGHGTQLIGLAAAHEVARIGPLAAAGHRGDGLRSGGLRELPELLQILGLHRRAEAQANEHRALTGAWALEHLGSDAGSFHSAGVSGATVPSSAARRTLRAGTTVEIACL